MKSPILTAILLAFAAQAGAQVQVGPIVDAATGDRYYRTAPMTRSAAATLAASMHGSLVTIHNAAANEWVRTNVASATGNTAECWIGLEDIQTEGQYVWASGDPVVYLNWGIGEPNNYNNAEDGCTLVPGTGRWNDQSIDVQRPALIAVSGPIQVPLEYPTIQAAINAASNGQTIEVAPGVYSGSFDFGYKKLIVRSTDGPLATTIRTSTLSNGIIMAGGQGPETVLDGFTILPGGATPDRQLAILDGQTVRNCRISGGIIGILASSFATISDCVILNCAYGVFATPAGRPTDIVIQNCTFASVQVGVYASNDPAVGRNRVSVVNTIVAAVAATAVRSSPMSIGFAYCDTTRGLEPGVGNFVAPPRFVNAPGPDGLYDVADDYTLASDSRCVDAGNNALRRPLLSAGAPLDAQGRDRFVDAATADTGAGPGAVVDIGAAEFSPSLPICPVDFNADGFVDFFDYDDFVTAFESGC